MRNSAAIPSVNLTACKLRLQVPSALRAPAAGYLQRQRLLFKSGMAA